MYTSTIFSIFKAISIMKILVLFSVFAAMLNACVDPSSTLSFRFVNNSSFAIDLYNYANDSIIKKMSILPSESVDFSFSKDDPEPITPFFDSVKVTFNDTVSIVHRRTVHEGSRDLNNLESYAGGSKNTGAKHAFLYEYEYIFTDADYQEAASK